MTIAASEGHLIYLVIIAVIGIINWLTKKDDKPKADPGRTPPPTAAPRVAGPEQERMRRFMEALGVPAETPPPVPVQRRQAPPLPQLMPQIRPRGPVVAPNPVPAIRRPRPLPTVPTPRSAPVPVPPSLTVAQTHVSELQVPQVALWDTVSSHVSAIPFEASHADMRDAYKTPTEAPVDESANKFRALLRSPESLRAAIVLREILGPPRSLQSAERFPTFR